MKCIDFWKIFLALCWFLGMEQSQAAEKLSVKLAFVGNSQQSAYLGASQGLAEANLQGQFLNQSYSLTTINPENALTADYAGMIAVVAAVDRDTYLKLVNMLTGIPVFNVNLEEDDLRALCLPNALHVYPGTQMKQDAVAQWKKLHPEAQVIAQAWHPDFVKYAARDLNKRFSKAHNTQMDDASWSGWAAVKMSSDTVVRENMTDPGKLLEYLKTQLVFDGQKGIEMNFRVTGQLRQPILLIENGKITGEAPVRGVADDLDSLGNIECAK